MGAATISPMEAFTSRVPMAMAAERASSGPQTYSIIEADETISPEAAAQIQAHPPVQSALLIPRIS